MQALQNKIHVLRRHSSLPAVAGLAIALLVASAVGQAPAAKAVGTVKSVTGNSIVITTDAGTESTVTVPAGARVVRAQPGQIDLKSATPIPLSDIQPGDRIFVRGQAGDGGVLVAVSAIVMKKSDIAQRQQSEREEWRRGVGGIVKSVDAANGTIMISNSLAAAGKEIVVHVSPQTVIRRYAPDSIKFDDAMPGSLAEIKPGDQLRARGTKNAEGTEFTAQAIVSGSFRNIAGTVVSTDAASRSVTVLDLATNKPVSIHVSNDSELRKLPPFVAARWAQRLKGGSPDQGATGQTGGRSEDANSNSGQGGGKQWQGRGGARSGEAGGNSGPGGQGGNWRGSGGAPDIQQILSRMPAISISDLNKGDAVMLVATEGTPSAGPTAITLVAGVEPILSASPTGAGAAMMLSPWNLGGAEAATGGEASQ